MGGDSRCAGSTLPACLGFLSQAAERNGGCADARGRGKRGRPQTSNALSLISGTRVNEAMGLAGDGGTDARQMMVAVPDGVIFEDELGRQRGIGVERHGRRGCKLVIGPRANDVGRRGCVRR